MSKLRKLKSPQSARVRNLALALALIGVSVVGVNFVISTNNHTDTYLVAKSDLPAGSPLGQLDAVTASANLGESASHYLHESDLPSGAYLLGPIRAGQLIPKSMLATAVIDERVPIVVDSDMGLSTGLVAGASVDLWVTPINEDKTPGEPYVLVLGAEVSRLLESKEMFANKNPSVELWVPVDAVGPVLAATSSGFTVSLVLRPTLADG